MLTRSRSPQRVDPQAPNSVYASCVARDDQREPLLFPVPPLARSTQELERAPLRRRLLAGRLPTSHLMALWSSYRTRTCTSSVRGRTARMPGCVWRACADRLLLLSGSQPPPPTVPQLRVCFVAAGHRPFPGDFGHPRLDSSRAERFQAPSLWKGRCQHGRRAGWTLAGGAPFTRERRAAGLVAGVTAPAARCRNPYGDASSSAAAGRGKHHHGRYGRASGLDRRDLLPGPCEHPDLRRGGPASAPAPGLAGSRPDRERRRRVPLPRQPPRELRRCPGRVDARGALVHHLCVRAAALRAPARPPAAAAKGRGEQRCVR